MKAVANPIFRAIMSGLMVSGALALAMPLVGIVQSTGVLLYTFIGVSVLLSIYEISVAPKG